jgi:hypothetical protein
MDGTLQWYEPSIGVVVTVLSFEGGVDGAELLAFAEDLEPGRPGEVDDLVKAYGGSGPAGRLQPGEVVVVEGEPGADGQPAWQVVASDDGSEGFGLSFVDNGGSTGVGFSGGWDTLSINVAEHADAAIGDQIGVSGLVTRDAAEVVIEAPGHEAIRVELHPVEDIEGWEDLVFAGLVPLDLGPAEVVALTADGTELERLSWSVDEGSTGSASATAGESSGSTSGPSSSEEVVEAEACRPTRDRAPRPSRAPVAAATERSEQQSRGSPVGLTACRALPRQRPRAWRRERPMSSRWWWPSWMVWRASPRMSRSVGSGKL